MRKCRNSPQPRALSNFRQPSCPQPSFPFPYPSAIIPLFYILYYLSRYSLKFCPISTGISMLRSPLHSAFKMYFNLKITRTGAQMSKYTLLQTTQHIFPVISTDKAGRFKVSCNHTTYLNSPSPCSDSLPLNSPMCTIMCTNEVLFNYYWTAIGTLFIRCKSF